jgi:soluble lytic murein transglycosylase-like protein
MRSLRPLLVALPLLALYPAPADAQIYAWRDDAGTLVLSDRPLSKKARIHSYPVAQGASVRTTSPILGSRSTLYDELILRHSRDNGIRVDLVRAVIQAESAYDPWARSIKGAMGLMQIMPATASAYGVVNPYDPAENIRAGVAYLRRLLDRFNENEELALAAYNAGPETVDRYGRRIPPYRETRTYVARIRTATERSAPSRTRIYRRVEVIDGREVATYTNKKPALR